jgi:hypothetical protein
VLFDKISAGDVGVERPVVEIEALGLEDFLEEMQK